ncbi:MAG: Curli production assembly/transport component CsgG [Syntrophaceae bacterium PtaU1.Bin231]|nr:MAG: Curli production assembly/transport component CsgG [Syntrophaceae bacterium PtaU1.Bin231]
MKEPFPRLAVASLLTMCLTAILAGCSEIRLNTLPAPPPTAKLRVFVLPVTSTPHPAGAWPVSDKDFSDNQYRHVSRTLQMKGFYQVIPRDEVAAVLGNQNIEGWRWSAGNWKLAKDVGRALHADYINIFERKFPVRSVLSAEQIIISLSSGRIFRESIASTTTVGESFAEGVARSQEMMRNAYRKLFMAAKGDMFATAVRKGKAEKAPSKTPSPPAPAAPPPERRADLRTDKPAKDEIPSGLQAMLEEHQAGTTGKSRLVVYDFDAGEQLNVVAMILTEALREELHELGKFLLVNRENIVQVMEELKLQQSGMVDEGQAVQMGKWLAANETVTGKLAVLGSLYVLQAKRTDIQSLGTLGIGSLRSSMGKEEELLNGVPSLARKLAGLP